MATDQLDWDSLRSEDTDVVDRIKETVRTRREFLLGTAIGAAGVGGVASASLFADEAQGEHLAALPTNTSLPQLQYHLPAIGADNDGVVVGFIVTLTAGNGDIHVNLDNIEVRHDVQLALREATTTALAATNMSLNDRDVLVSFIPPDDNRMVLRGKSWEAGLTVGLASIFAEQTPPQETLVTGIIGPDGTLLPVENVKSKAIAARQFRADLLLAVEELVTTRQHSQRDAAWAFSCVLAEYPADQLAYIFHALDTNPRD